MSESTIPHANSCSYTHILNYPVSLHYHHPHGQYAYAECYDEHLFTATGPYSKSLSISMALTQQFALAGYVGLSLNRILNDI